MSAHREVASRMADIAVELIASCAAEQLAVLAWPMDDTAERERFFYTPVDHGGLALVGMRPAQQRLVFRLLAAGLSEGAYNTVCTIVGLDNLLDRREGFTMAIGRERGRDPSLYYARIFGNPAGSEPWAWRFGGHHVSLNFVVVDGELSSATPAFLGADPASAPLLGPHLLRPLAAAEDLGRALVQSLDEEQRSIAVLSPVAPLDLVSANRARYGLGEGDLPLALADVFGTALTPEMAQAMRASEARQSEAAGITAATLERVRLHAEQAKGLPAGRLSAAQQEMLRAVLDVYVGRVPDGLADAELAKYADADGLGALSFAWAGGIEVGAPHYYRVQGPTLLAEYDNTQRGANHVHTVWRDPRHDFGADALSAHYARHDH